MPNLHNRTFKDIHKSILNIGGSGVGVRPSLLPLCDGDGNSTGISISENSIGINARRGVLDNFFLDGSCFSKMKIDRSFPNTPDTRQVSSSESKTILDIDEYSCFLINFNRIDFTPMFLLKSFYFEKEPDGYELVVGYWQRTFSGIEKYFVNEDFVQPEIEIDESQYYFDPDLNSFNPDTGEIAIQGLIKRRESNPLGVRHENSFLVFHLLISSNEDVPLRYENVFDNMWTFLPTDGTGSPYLSISQQSAFSRVKFIPMYANFDKSEMLEKKTLFKVCFANPSAHRLLSPITEESECLSYGEEYLQNLDLRLYLSMQLINGDVPAIVYKIS